VYQGVKAVEALAQTLQPPRDDVFFLSPRTPGETTPAAAAATSFVLIASISHHVSATTLRPRHIDATLYDVLPSSSLGLAAAESCCSKQPVWSPALRSWTLDFNGRVESASRKNVQLVRRQDPRAVVFSFGRTQHRDVFTADFGAPLSCVQAFALAISSCLWDNAS
jgi:hypothetical protein